MSIICRSLSMRPTWRRPYVPASRCHSCGPSPAPSMRARTSTLLNNKPHGAARYPAVHPGQAALYTITRVVLMHVV